MNGAVGVMFREACGLDATAVAAVQTQVRQRVLRACVHCGLLEQGDAHEMGGWDQHDAEHLRYDIPKPRPDGPRTLVLTPLGPLRRRPPAPPTTRRSAPLHALCGRCCWRASTKSGH